LYRELLDLYYDTEQPLNPDFDKLARRVLATTDELRAVLQGLLDEFFTLQDDGWHNERCDIELAAYLKKQEQQSLAGKASAAKRKGGKKPAPLAGGAAGGQPGQGGDGEPGATDVERSLNDRQPTRTRTRTISMMKKRRARMPWCLLVKPNGQRCLKSLACRLTTPASMTARSSGRWPTAGAPAA
jgi:uncharacterized protein YdaU (DUF1376 family)